MTIRQCHAHENSSLRPRNESHRRNARPKHAYHHGDATAPTRTPPHPRGANNRQPRHGRQQNAGSPRRTCPHRRLHSSRRTRKRRKQRDVKRTLFLSINLTFNGSNHNLTLIRTRSISKNEYTEVLRNE